MNPPIAIEGNFGHRYRFQPSETLKPQLRHRGPFAISTSIRRPSGADRRSCHQDERSRPKSWRGCGSRLAYRFPTAFEHRMPSLILTLAPPANVPAASVPPRRPAISRPSSGLGWCTRPPRRLAPFPSRLQTPQVSLRPPMKIKDFIVQADTATALASKVNAEAADLARCRDRSHRCGPRRSRGVGRPWLRPRPCKRRVVSCSTRCPVVCHGLRDRNAREVPVVTVDAEVREEPVPVGGLKRGDVSGMRRRRNWSTPGSRAAWRFLMVTALRLLQYASHPAQQGVTSLPLGSVVLIAQLIVQAKSLQEGLPPKIPLPNR